MRKSIVLGLICLACLFGVAYAQETTPAVVDTTVIDVPGVMSGLPNLKQGIGYSIVDSKINYLTTIEVINVKKVSFAVGYAGVAKSTGDKLIATVSYPLFAAEKYVTWDLIKYLKFEPGVYAGVGRILGSNEFDYGVSATFLDVKF